MSHSCTDPSGLCTVLSGQTAFCANLGVEEIPDKLTMNVPFGMKNKANVNIAYCEYYDKILLFFSFVS